MGRCRNVTTAIPISVISRNDHYRVDYGQRCSGDSAHVQDYGYHCGP